MAIVISVILLFLGALAIKTLPVSQFPSIAPPTHFCAGGTSAYFRQTSS